MNKIFGKVFGEEPLNPDIVKALGDGYEYYYKKDNTISNIKELLCRVNFEKKLTKITVLFYKVDMNNDINNIKKYLYKFGFKFKKENIMMSNKMLAHIDSSGKNLITLNIWHSNFSSDYEKQKNDLGIRGIGIFGYILGEYIENEVKFDNKTSDKHGIKDHTFVITEKYKDQFYYSIKVGILSKTKGDRDKNIDIVLKHLKKQGMEYQSKMIVKTLGKEKTTEYLHFLGNPPIEANIDFEDKVENKDEDFLLTIEIFVEDFILNKRLIGLVHEKTKISAFNYIIGTEMFEDENDIYFGWNNEQIESVYIDLISKNNILNNIKVRIVAKNAENKKDIINLLVKDLEEINFSIKKYNEEYVYLEKYDHIATIDSNDGNELIELEIKYK